MGQAGYGGAGEQRIAKDLRPLLEASVAISYLEYPVVVGYSRSDEGGARLFEQATAERSGSAHTT
jgi:hypothetical protein